MQRKHFSAFSASQRGVALLMSMLFIFLAVSAWILEQSEVVSARHRRDKATATALALAKEALIARAATDASRPGSLPCPDTNNDGIAQLFAGNHCPSYIGRLPWKTLDLLELLDGHGQGLWYALSPGLRDDDSAQPINSQKPLELTLDGMQNIAAIVFSAGPPVANQNGRPSNSVADYLDATNNDGDHAYVSGPPSATFNDTALAITRDDIFRSVNQRVLAEIRGPDENPPKRGLRRYYAEHAVFPDADSGGDGFSDVEATAGKLPYNEIALNAGPPALAPYTWLHANAWLPLITYQRFGAVSSRIAIGSSRMDVIPCPASPCP